MRKWPATFVEQTFSSASCTELQMVLYDDGGNSARIDWNVIQYVTKTMT